ncbi:MAG: TRAP transporter small permease [Rhodospirillales bacterium]
MAEASGSAARPADPVGRVLFDTARALAVVGGVLCAAMAVLVTVSVTGRYLFAAPVPGDFDLVGIISGCAAFAFLPYCQMVRGNVVVDFFTTGVPARGRAALDGAGSLIYLVVAGLFTWRMYYGAWELRESGQVLAAIDFYRWWTLPFAMLCMVVLVAAVLYTLAGDVRAAGKDAA